MRTNGGYMAECEDCEVTQEFKTQKQRSDWVFKRHIGHTIWQWRQVCRKAPTG